MVRLALLLSALSAFGMTLATFVALTLGEDALLRRVDATLEDMARRVVSETEVNETARLIIRPVTELDALPGPFSRVAREGGGTVRLERDFRRSDDWRAIIAQDARGTAILIAVPLEEAEDALELLAGILWTTTLIVCGLALVFGGAAGFLAQRRLARINDTLEDLAAGDLSARTGSQRSRDDLDDIAASLDATAAALERLMAQTRQLSASVAHDLRTPLARLRAKLEGLPESPARGAALEEATRLATIFDTIMRVAKIEAQHGDDGFHALEIAGLLDEVEEIFGPVVEDAGKILARTGTSTATVRADRQMLIQALANLIQNALVHGGDEIRLLSDGGEIGVADNGPGVDPAQYGEIIKPMVRLDAARESEGSGLGLALVRAVAERHRAPLRLAAEAPQGLRVTMKLAEL